MIRVASAISDLPNARDAARAAARDIARALDGAAPKLAIVFGSVAYADLAEAPSAVAGELGGAPVIGGTSGGAVFAPPRSASRAVGVTVLAGDTIEASVATAPLRSPALLDVVPAAATIAADADDAAARGLSELAAFVLAPSGATDGEALVAAVRKGSGERAILAGGLTGDELTFDRAGVFADGELRSDRVTIAGVYTTRPLGVAARHGWRAIGPARTATRTEGPWLLELDGMPALEAWLADVRAAGGSPPPVIGRELAVYLANRFVLGIVDDARREPIVRVPFDSRADGAVLMSASMPEGTRTRVTHATDLALVSAAQDAARVAADAAGGDLAGAILFACTGRLATLGDAFPEEPRAIADLLATGPGTVGGACVYGEIARGRREQDAFHNTTVVVVAVPR